MSEPRRRKPLPALVCLIALTLLTALVWWRVLNRNDGSAEAKDKNSCSKSQQTTLPYPTRVTVNVLNSTKRTGLAKTTAGRLTKLGFKVSGYGNDTGHAQIAGVAEIRYAADQKLAAQLLTYYFPGATEVALTDEPAGKLIVSLGVKYTSIPAASSIRAAMTADGVQVQPRTAAAAPLPSPSC